MPVSERAWVGERGAEGERRRKVGKTLQEIGFLSTFLTRSPRVPFAFLLCAVVRSRISNFVSADEIFDMARSPLYASDKTGVNELDGTQLDTLIVISISASRLHRVCTRTTECVFCDQRRAGCERAGAGEY